MINAFSSESEHFPGLKIWNYPELYSKPSQASKMEFFKNIVNGVSRWFFFKKAPS